MIKQGAKLVESVEDILEELVMQPTGRPATSQPLHNPSEMAAAESELADDDPVLAALGMEPATLDSLCARTGFGAAELSSRLLEYELVGQVIRLPGGLFQRAGRA